MDDTFEPPNALMDLGLGPAAPAPAPPAAPPTLQSFLPHPGIAQKIAPFAVLAAALLGGKKMNGLAQGYAQGQHQMGQEDLQRAQVMQQDAYRQSQAQVQQQEFQQRQAQLEEAKRQKALNDIKANVAKVTDPKQYDQMIDAYAAQMQLAGFRTVTPNQLRIVAPLYVKGAKETARAFLDDFFKKPYNMDTVKSDPAKAFAGGLDVDLNGDGVKERKTLKELMDVADYGVLTDEKGQPLGYTKEGPVGSAFQEVYKAGLARFVADNKREPDPKEKQALVEKSIKKAAEEQRAPQEETDPMRVASTAQAILEHRMAPSQLSLGGGSMGKSPFRQAVVAEVNRQNPTFNWQQAEANYQYGKNTGTQTTVRYLDQVEKTLPVLEQASADFARSGVRVINKAILATKSQFGATDVTKFEFARNILADEIAKVLQGGGTGNGTSDAKLRQAQDLLSGDMTPAQLSTAIATARDLMKSRRETLTSGTFMEKPDAGTSDDAIIAARKKGRPQ